MSEFPSPSDICKITFKDNNFECFEDEQTEHFCRLNGLCHMKIIDRNVRVVNNLS